MRHKIATHVRRNIVAYVAVVATLGGTSYAAAANIPAAAADNATATRHRPDDQGDGGYGRHGRYGRDGRGGAQRPDEGRGSDPDGSADPNGDNAPDGGSGTGAPADPAAGQGGGNIVAKARSMRSVVARHGGSTDIPFSGSAWAQPGGDLELVAGTLVIGVPGKCTGGFGNVLTLSVDGKPVTFAAPPPAFQAGTVTVPFLIGTLSEPGQQTQHQLTAKFANSCTKDGEDYTIQNVNVDVLSFH